MNKPVDVIHQLKLDNTFIMERQTLGNQTAVPIFLYDDSPKILKQEPRDKGLEEHKVVNNNNFTSIGNASTFSILNDQIISIVPIKNEPTTSYEHEYCYNNVTIKQEVLDIIDDFTIKQEYDAKVLNQAVQDEKINCSIRDHAYNLPADKEGMKSLKKHKSPVEQAYNELIYGLGPHYLNPVRSRARIVKRKVIEKVNTTPEKPTSILFVKKKKKIHFKSSMIKPVDVIHQRKLDNTFMERQTLGNQTTVPIFLYDDSPKIPKQEPIDKGLEQHKVINNNNFTSIGNSSTFSILNDQIISTVKNEPTTSYEHDCCYDNVTIKQEVLDIIDDFTVKEECDAKAVQLKKKYCSSVTPASLIVQLKNRNCSIRDHAYNLPADKKGLKGGKNLVVPVTQAYNELIYGLGPHYLDHVRPPKVVEKVNTTPEKSQNAEIEVQGSVDSENMIDELLSETTDEQRQPASQFSVTPIATRQPSPRGGQIPQELQEAGRQLKESFSILSNVISKKQIEEDECDLYGKILAKKLRKLPEEERQTFMYEIDGMYIRRYGSGGINNTPSSSHSSNKTQFSNSPLPPLSGSSVPTRPSSSRSTYSNRYPLQIESDLHILTTPSVPISLQSHDQSSTDNSLLSPSQSHVPTRPSSSRSTYSNRYPLQIESDLHILTTPSVPISLQSHDQSSTDNSVLSPSESHDPTRPSSFHSTYSKTNYPLQPQLALHILNRRPSSHSSQSHVSYLEQNTNYFLLQISSQSGHSNATFLQNIPQETSHSPSSPPITILSVKTKAPGRNIINDAYFNAIGNNE